MELKNKIAFITGGTSGIGLEYAKKLLNEDCKVIVCGRNENQILEVKNKYKNLDVVKCDITKETDIKKIHDYIAKKYGHLDLLFNNAGIQFNYNFVEDDKAIEKVRTEIDINLVSQINITKKILNLLLLKEGSAIINIASALAKVPKQSAISYCSSKAGLMNFSRVLRYQLEDKGVKVFTVYPPLVDTAMTKGRGKNKATPESVAKSVIQAMKKDRYEIAVGKVNLLFGIHRLIPNLAYKILKNE
jgi:uncharacterized oxidoreductase